MTMRRAIGSGIAILGAIVAATWAPAVAQDRTPAPAERPWLNRARPVEHRVTLLLAAMTEAGGRMIGDEAATRAST